MNYERTLSYLNTIGQSQLLEYYGILSETEREILLKDIENVNFSVIENIEKRRGTSNFSDIKPIPARSVQEIERNKEQYEKDGLKLLKEGKVGAVLLAGGQGTRLGFDKPKGMFNIGVNRNLSIFEQLFCNIREVTDKSGVYFHVFVMTSDLNDADTKEFFTANNFFGYPEEKIHFYVQDKEPVCDLNGKVYLFEKHRVAQAPNGNGGWYSSLLNSDSGKILEKEGIEWINVFSVDNVLQRICDPVFIGATVQAGMMCGAKVISKTRAEEKVGVLCEQDGRPTVVEYFEMPSDLAEKRDENGNLIFRYGVTLNYLFNVKVLNKVVSESLPYHLAVKAVPHIENGVKVNPVAPCAYKFETLIVDMVKLMGNCLAYEVERSREFAPVKNKTGVDSVDTARQLLEFNGVKL